MQPGEALHKAGEDGARRAKRYLDATTRVKTSWLNTDARHAARMTFGWPHSASSYSFDIAGLMHGGEFEGDLFAAECKLYLNHRNHQASEYREFLAKCYSTDSQRPGHFNQYMWITWHPFSQNSWSELTSEPYIRDAVIGEHAKLFGTEDVDSARGLVDSDLLRAISTKLWIWVLSRRQESLVITPENRAIVFAQAIKDDAL